MQMRYSEGFLMPSDRSYRSGMPEPGFVDPNRGFTRRPEVEQPEPQQQEAEPAPRGWWPRAEGRRSRSRRRREAASPDAAYVRSQAPPARSWSLQPNKHSRPSIPAPARARRAAPARDRRADPARRACPRVARKAPPAAAARASTSARCSPAPRSRRRTHAHWRSHTSAPRDRPLDRAVHRRRRG